MISFLALAPLLGQASTVPVMLKHTFTKGMKSEYTVDANLQVEERRRGLTTFLPEEQEIKYTFYTNTLDVAGAVATVRYSRPTLTVIAGASTDSDPVPKTDRLDMLAVFQLSPINE